MHSRAAHAELRNQPRPVYAGVMRAADEVVEFLAREIPARALADFSPLEATRRRG